MTFPGSSDPVPVRANDSEASVIERLKDWREGGAQILGSGRVVPYGGRARGRRSTVSYCQSRVSD